MQKTQTRISGLDGIRGVAAMWIAIFHLWQWNRPDSYFFFEHLEIIYLGNKAVAIFCALSGYVILRSLLLEEKHNTKSTIFKNFEIHRFFRIYPLFAITTTCIFLLNINKEIDKEELFFTLILKNVWNPGHAIINPVTWSLFVEISFYICIPALLVFRENQRNLLLAIFLAGFIFLEQIYSVREVLLVKYLILGAIAYQIDSRLKETHRQISFVVGTSLLLLDLKLSLSGIMWNTYLTNPKMPDYSYLLLLALFFLLLGSRSKLCQIIFGGKFLSALGKASYSIFLIHPILLAIFFKIDFLQNGTIYKVNTNGQVTTLKDYFLFLLVLIGTSFLSYRLIELPIMNLGRGPNPPKPLLIR